MTAVQNKSMTTVWKGPCQWIILRARISNWGNPSKSNITMAKLISLEVSPLIKGVLVLERSYRFIQNSHIKAKNRNPHLFFIFEFISLNVESFTVELVSYTRAR